MARIEKTVFISYRRTDVYTALAVYENLKNQGYDVFFDYRSISSGDFEQIITSNIRARAHFLLILTPTALDRCNEPGDWLRREIELAMDEKRNVVPLFFKGFRFGSSSPSGISKWLRFGKPEVLTGKLGQLTRYNGLNVHEDYFDEAMARLQTEYLSKPLDTVLHPVSTQVRKVVKEEQDAADEALKQKEDAKKPEKTVDEKSVEKNESPKPITLEFEKNEVGRPDESLDPVSMVARNVVKEEQGAADEALKQREVVKEPVKKVEEKPTKKKELPSPVPSKPEKKKVSSLTTMETVPWRKLGGIAGVLAVIALCIWGGTRLYGNLANNDPQLTQISQATMTTTQTPEPMSTNTPPANVTSSPTSSCYGLSFIKDVTIPDGTTMQASQVFTKTWRVSNTGSCSWDIGSEFVFYSGDSMGGATHIISSPVAVGEDYEVSIEMIAPTKTGKVSGFWRFSTKSGQFIGEPVYVQIVVQDTTNLDVGSTMTGKDGMTLLYVPAGEFTMGSDAEIGVNECLEEVSPSDSDYCENTIYAWLNEEPPHVVNLDAFWIDQIEVTNAMYAMCVSSGECDPPSSKKSPSRDSYYSNSQFDDYPIIYVSWDNARAYCSWVGRRLPTEAEWEKAARGIDERIYPWGNEFPNENLTNTLKYVGDTTEVGSYPLGASPYGALDMAGNVWEWVNDWYSEDYYSGSPSFNPLGPVTGTDRVMRGGSWSNVGHFVRSSLRYKGYSPDTKLSIIGFRCAMDATP